MEMPKYHLRMLSKTQAAVFRIGLNDQRRIQWERCGQVSVADGKITMLNGMRQPPDLEAHCNAALQTLKDSKKTNPAAFAALIAMGQLAEATNSLGHTMDTGLFELLIWSEADLKNGLVSNIGMEMLAEDDREKYILQGQQYMNEGDFAQAEATFLTALKKFGNNTNVFNFLAIALARQGKKTGAADAINQSVGTQSRNIGYMLRGVQYNLDAGNTQKAQEYITKLAENTTLPAAQALQVSRLAIRAGLGDIGRELARDLVEKGKGGTEALEHLVNITAAHSGEKQVFAVMRAQAQNMPETARLKEWYLRMLIADDKLEIAKTEARNWLQQDPQSAQAHFQFGRVYLAMQKPRRALRALTQCATLSPENAACQKLIADACMMLSDLAGAAAASEKACRMAPDNPHFLSQSKRITEALLAQNLNPDQKNTPPKA